MWIYCTAYSKIYIAYSVYWSKLDWYNGAVNCKWIVCWERPLLKFTIKLDLLGRKVCCWYLDFRTDLDADFLRAVPGPTALFSDSLGFILGCVNNYYNLVRNTKKYTYILRIFLEVKKQNDEHWPNLIVGKKVYSEMLNEIKCKKRFTCLICNCNLCGLIRKRYLFLRRVPFSPEILSLLKT